MLTDSHCHLASHRFQPPELPDLIERAVSAGVTRLVSLATRLDDIPANLSIADHPHVHAGIGIHPCDAHHAPDNTVSQLASFTGDPRVCVIGETGLDYYHPAPDGWNENDFRNRQRELLRQHFELAANANLNIVIHTRDASGHQSFDDAFEMYRDFHASVRAVFHCFIGPWSHAKRVLDLGGLVSFGGVATFKSARDVRDTVCHCPAGSFMVETDAPYLAPEPHRGSRNEPAFVRNTAEFLATLREESLDDFSHHTEAAATAFFRFSSAIH